MNTLPCRLGIVALIAVMLPLRLPRLLGYGNASCSEAWTGCKEGEAGTGTCTNKKTYADCQNVWDQGCTSDKNGGGYECIPTDNATGCTPSGGPIPCGDWIERKCRWQVNPPKCAPNETEDPIIIQDGTCKVVQCTTQPSQ
jgi:hypothetical protein